MSESKASIHEANKLVRVLNDTRLKFTVRVHHADGKVTEWQSDLPTKVKYNDEARALWYTQGDYETRPIMPVKEGDVLLVEENPKA